METIEVLQNELGVEGIQHLEDMHLLMKVQLAMMAYCKDHYKPAYNIVEDGPREQKVVFDEKVRKYKGRMPGAKNKPKAAPVEEDTPPAPSARPSHSDGLDKGEEKDGKHWPDNVYHNSKSPGRPKKIKEVVETPAPIIDDEDEVDPDFVDTLQEEEPVKKDKRGWPPLVVTDPDRITKKDIEGKSDHTEGKVPFRVNERTTIYIDPNLSKEGRQKLIEKNRIDVDMIGVTSNGNNDGREFVSTFNK